MGLTYDHTRLAVVALLLITSEEGEGAGHSHNLITDLSQRKGPDAAADHPGPPSSIPWPKPLNLTPVTFLDSDQLGELNRIQDGSMYALVDATLSLDGPSTFASP